MIAVVSHEISSDFERVTGITTVPLKPYKKLDHPVQSHSDMLICVIDRSVFCYEDYFNENIDVFKAIIDEEYTVKFVSNQCKSQYPYDISLNVLIMGKDIFCKEEYTAKEIIDYANNNGYIIHNINQGYSACSTLAINENVAITGDVGMKKALEQSGKNVFLVDHSKIRLKGYNHGFVGGSSAVNGFKIYFFGNPNTIDGFQNITEIISDYEISLIPTEDNMLFDYGGVKFFEKPQF